MDNTVNMINELANIQAQNKRLVATLKEQKNKIDFDVAHGTIDTVTAFMRYKALEKKSEMMLNKIN